MSDSDQQQMATTDGVKSATGPVEPTKPPEIDPETNASAANAVEQWRNYQQAYSAYQQQCAAYQHYVQQTQYAQTVEQQQTIYSQYLEQHRLYQYQLQQYEQYKLGNGLGPYGSTLNWQPVNPMQSYPIDPSMMQTEFQHPIRPSMGPLALVPANGNHPEKPKSVPDGKHRRDGKSKPKQKPFADEKKSELHTKTVIYLNPDDEKLLPQELKQLFGDFHCNLCRTRMNSHISANIHYQSKSHEKKINQWLKEYCLATDTPMPVRQRPALEVAADTTSIGKSVFHCEACDLVLTSVQHANQHYTGKRHAMVVNGKKLPTGNGHYNSEGKWIRTANIVTDVVVPSTETPSTVAPPSTANPPSAANQSPSIGKPVFKRRLLEPLEHEDTTQHVAKKALLEPPPDPPKELVAQILEAEIDFSNDIVIPPINEPSAVVTLQLPKTGLSAAKPIETINVDSDDDVVEVKDAVKVDDAVDEVIKPPAPPALPSAFPLSSAQAAETTLEEEIRKKDGLTCVDATGTFCLICETSVTSRTEMVTHMKGAKHVKKALAMGVIVRTTPYNAFDTILRSLSMPAQQTDWSLYRMPSGKFYCKTCNLIVSDEKLFGQHWYGKKHKLKLRQQQHAEELARTGGVCTTNTRGGPATTAESSFVQDDQDVIPMANPTGSGQSVHRAPIGATGTKSKRRPFSKKWLYYYRKAKWAQVNNK